MRINILGTDYTITFKDYQDDKLFSSNDYSGYCNEITKDIVICNINTFPGCEDDPKEVCELSEKQTLRHEIVHAFLNESGLSHSSLRYSAGWAKNEEMVDFIALQGLKIYEAWKQANAI